MPTKKKGKGIKPTLKQKRFVKEYLETGNRTEAAARAYDVKDRNSARTLGTQNLAKRSVQKLLEEQAEISANDIATLRDELRESKKEYGVRLRANQDILDRAGFKPKEDKTAGVNVFIGKFYDQRIHSERGEG